MVPDPSPSAWDPEGVKKHGFPSASLGQGREGKELRSLGLLYGALGLLQIHLGNLANNSPKCHESWKKESGSSLILGEEGT